jgi:hypothetical protein
MTNPPRPELSSVFDDMLSQNKKSFDDLYRGGRTNSGKSGRAVAPPFRPKGTTLPSPAVVPSVQLDPQSTAARRLRERFGNDWRYEIKERQREGDEVIVLCKLTFGKAAAVRTQFGRAKISRGPVLGASSGVRFKIGQAGAEGDENDAFRRATEAALTNCLELI